MFHLSSARTPYIAFTFKLCSSLTLTITLTLFSHYYSMSLPRYKLRSTSLMRCAREIWGRDSSTERAQMVEDRRFREFFGVSAMVAISVWRRLSRTSQIPFGGEPKHLLWALLFMKVYPTEGIMCKLIGIKCPKTFRGRVKDFIEAIADLESDVVSYSFNFCFVFLYIYLYFLFFLDSVQQ